MSGECWLYGGATNGRGYGVIGVSVPERRQDYAHRVMYQHARGPIPADLEVAHTCDVRNCVRPTHLTLLTHDGNVADMVEKRRQSRGTRRWSARLSEDDVRAIRRRVRQGERRKVVAEDYRLSVSAVDLIIARKRWGHIT